MAPIILFVYNRPEHTIRTISALRENLLALDSDLTIVSDAPKHPDAEVAVRLVRDYIHGVHGFRSVSIVEQERNLGLANSIISGVTNLFERNDSVIVLEDDLVTSRGFLTFMNQALAYYAKNPIIHSVSGFSFSRALLRPPPDSHSDVYFHWRPMSWSWGTWRDRWNTVDWEIRDFDSFRRDISAQRRFNRGGRDLTNMLNMQMAGRLDSWYIRWCYHAFRQGQLAVYPQTSMVRNIGHDGTGVHCGIEIGDVFSHRDLSSKVEFHFPANERVDPLLIRRYNSAFHPSLARRVTRHITRLVGRLSGITKPQ